MDSKTQPRADVSPDVNWSDADSPMIITPVHTVAVYSQSLPPRAAVTFSQAITPPAGLKDATPKPPEAVVADCAETSRSEDESKLHQAAALMSKLQGPAGDYINVKISPALGRAALNRTEEEDLGREVAEPATKLAEAQRQLQVLLTAMSLLQNSQTPWSRSRPPSQRRSNPLSHHRGL